jgi:hypothetical protein
MPVEVTERALLDALALAEEHDGEDGPPGQAALEWMGWEGEGPLWLRRYDVQLFVWYTLPRKFVAPLEHKREAAAALARTLERLGDRATSYAEMCRSDETDELLQAWEADDPSAWKRFRELLGRSGLEPPDTDLLAWGQVMGLEEARVREQVAIALEEGRLAPGGPRFRRRQAQVVNAALLEPWDGGDGRSRLDAVHAERLERWIKHRHTRGSAERRAIIAPVLALVAADAIPVDGEAARSTLAPVLWLLERADGGVALTQTGALNRALVREAVERWPAWWDTELFGPPNREDKISLLHELQGLLRSLRLVRRTGRRIVIPARGRHLREHPVVAARRARQRAALRRELSRRMRRARGRADPRRRSGRLRRRPRRADPAGDRCRGLAVGRRFSGCASGPVGDRRLPAPRRGNRNPGPERERLTCSSRAAGADRLWARGADRRAPRQGAGTSHRSLLTGSSASS